MAAHSMYFPKFQFQLGSPPILVTAPELSAFFTPTSKVSWKVESLLVVYGSYFFRPSKRSPMEQRAPAKGSSRDQCTRGPNFRNNTNSFCSKSTNAFISCSLYTVCRYCTSPGAPDLWARLGWLQGSTRNGMQRGRAHSTGGSSQ